ncbi:MAG: NAD+ synthase [Chitinophagales bacterium]|nr:NAD+ synthase [Chitinophagales bacterium]
MKIFLAQQNYHIGNIEQNTSKIIEAIEIAKQQGGDLIVFSELSVCGYPPKDLLNFKSFIDKCYTAIDKIKQHADNIGVLVGAPAHNTNNRGKSLFNAAFYLYEKEVKKIIHKTLLPTYDVFDEYRYFEPAFEWNIIEHKGKKLAVTICEDIWNITDSPLYRLCPMDELIKHQPDVMINLSASPFDYTHIENRKAIIKTNVLKYKLPIVYCNAVGCQTEIIFDGSSLVFNKDAQLIKELPAFKEAIESVEIDDEKNNETTINETKNFIAEYKKIPTALNEDLNISFVHDALVLGIQDYFSKMNFKKAIIGSSGGIDSAVVVALACEALGSKNVHTVLMPSLYSTEHSVNDAVKLSKNVQCSYDIINISNIYNSFLQSLQPMFKDLPFGLAEENIQSRVRGNLLMAISNKLGYILLNTSNKSELATGYGTLYGDMAGGLSILGDCYKLQVYSLANYINRNKEIIPNNVITKAPSAELRPNQKDSDSLPDYTVLDKILYQYIERNLSAEEIKSLGFDNIIVDKILTLVNNNEYKRHQFCPILRVSPKAFGTGRKMPIVGKYV